MDFDNLNNIIKFSKKILIISHVNPDGDTIGSMLAMYNIILETFKKHADMLAVSKVPEIYKFLPNTRYIKQLDEIDKSMVYDLVINVDIAAKDRAGEGEIFFDRAKNTVNIDHHKTNIGYADLNFITPERSSTGENLFYMFKSLGWNISLDTAKCLYAAILTDTGSFRFDNTKPETLIATAELIRIGVPVVEMYKKIYESDSKNLVQFQGYCVSKAKFLRDDKIAYTIVFKKDMEKFSANDECFEGLTEKLRAIVTTEIAFVAKEMKSGFTKFSFRSKNIDVAEICAIFNGGGHKFAAGCTIKAKPEDAVKMVLKEIERRNF